MKAPAFAYARPDTLPELIELKSKYGEDARFLAGGQSLMPALNMRLSAPGLLIDINGIAALRGICIDADRLVIGALTRHCDLESNPLVAQHAPLLKMAIRHVAHAAIRNRGTFGGSIANADPAAELPACALALDAAFVLAGADGERRVRAEEFFKGMYETALASDEVLVAGELPLLRAGYRDAFAELARRQGDYAIAGLAARAKVDAGVLADVRLALFGVSGAPTLARRTASLLEGCDGNTERVRAAQDEIAREAAAVADIYHSAVTKRHLVRVLLARVVGQLLERE